MTTAPEHFIRHGSAPCTAPLHYRGCGLDNIYLCNGYEVGESDGEPFTLVEDMEGLHKAISRHLVLNRKVLTGREIRFVRNTMDLTQSELARRMGTTSQTFARWEKEQTIMPGASDLMFRVTFLVWALPADKFAELVKKLPAELERMDEARNAPVQFRHDRLPHKKVKAWQEPRKLAIAA